MNEKKFSPLSLQYSLHINHINKAREHFEHEMASFIGDVSDILRSSLNEKFLEKEGLSIEECDVNKLSGSGRLYSLNVRTSFKIMFKPKGKTSKRFEIGQINTGIKFEDNLQNYSWFLNFHNSNKLDRQIDERCRDMIHQLKGEEKESFQNSIHYKSDSLYFFKKEVNESFSKDIEEPIFGVCEMLLQSIRRSEDYLKIYAKKIKVAA